MDIDYTTSDSEADQDYIPCFDCLELLTQKDEMFEMICNLKRDLVQEKKKVCNLKKQLKRLQLSQK